MAQWVWASHFRTLALASPLTGPLSDSCSRFQELFKAFDNRAVQGSSVFVSHEDADAKDVTPISDIVGGSWAGVAIINLAFSGRGTVDG